MQKIVLAYSGGLDTSVAIPWLAEKYRAEIVTVTLDLGQGRELDDVRERALAHRRRRARTCSTCARSSRATSCCRRSRPARCTKDAIRWRPRSARPLIAKHLVEIARIEGATAVAHGCTGKGNDQVRIDVSARALDPSIKVIAPAREWGLTRPTRSSTRAPRHPAPDRRRQPVLDRREPLGPVDRVRRARRSVGGAGRGHLHR